MHCEVLLIFFVAVFQIVNGQERFLCTEKFCDEYIENVKCPTIDLACRAQNSTHNGRLFPSPTECNCCNICVTNLNEGDYCTVGSPGSPLPTQVCGPGLYCKSVNGGHASCQPMGDESICYKDRNKFDADRDKGLTGSMAPRPKCDGNGFYEPIVCIPGQTCFCVSQEGKRIFGDGIENTVRESEMKCECSRLANDARQLIESKYPIMTARCDAKGSYESLQCTMGYCFCVSANGDLSSDRKNITQGITTLPCYNRTLHRHIDSMETYWRPCEIMNFKKYGEMHDLQEDGYLLMDFKFENCQPDGWFSLVQQNETHRFCSDIQGNLIESFAVLLTDSVAKDMNCKCARARKLLIESNALEVLECNEIGNYPVSTCRRGLCYCLNEDGLQNSAEVPTHRICDLPCCKNNQCGC